MSDEKRIGSIDVDEHGGLYLELYIDEQGIVYIKDVYEGEEHLFEIDSGSYAGLASEKRLKKVGRFYLYNLYGGNYEGI